MYFGGSVMTFALPYGAFIVIAVVLFYLYRRPHSGPRLKYLASGPVASLLTREPGPVPAPAATTPETAVPETVAPETAEAEARAEDDATGSASEGKEGKE